MGSLSIWHWLIVLAVLLLVFGGKLPKLATDAAQAIKNFRKGMQDGTADSDPNRPKVTDSGVPGASDTATSKDKAAQG